MQNVKVGKSKIHRRGLFAEKDVNKGKIVCIIKGPKIFKMNKNIKDALAHPNWVGIKMNNWVDPIPPFKYLNHSCNPNSAIKGRVTLVAIRDIRKGEEITIDYSITEGDTRWYMKCNCNYAKCRGIIRSIQFLPLEIYKKYYPFISKEFQKVYQNKLKKNV